MRSKKQLIEDGLYGLLIGDALGVPYEFHDAKEIPPYDEIDFTPPVNFARTYPDVQPGTWSDDGAQALCLLDSLLTSRKLNIGDLATRLCRWVEEGLWTADGRVFDCGVQTMQSLVAYEKGMAPDKSGFVVPDGKGNGSLMRVLPLSLWHIGTDEELAADAHKQSLVTHGHVCNQVCCALYCLWARGIMQEETAEGAYLLAVSKLRRLYESRGGGAYLRELDMIEAEGEPTGSGYVVDSIRSSKYLVEKANTYEEVVKGAVALGKDTDTTAAIAGGLAGLAFGDLPQKWKKALRGREKVEILLQRFYEQCAID